MDRKAQVVLRRAVAKITVKLNLQWKPLDARRTVPSERSFYQFRDVAKRTHVVEHANLLLIPPSVAYVTMTTLLRPQHPLLPGINICGSLLL